jgi:hypothetical protein
MFMHGALPPSILAEALLIMAWKCLVCLAPLLVVLVMTWLAFRTDRIIAWLYPDLEWEKSLGWLNIRAERRATTALRWVGYAVHLALLGALYGVAWAAVGLQGLIDATDPLAAVGLALRIPVLVLGLGAWLLYFGSWLIPRLRSEREEAELKRFRAKMDEAERERERNPPSRVKAPLLKPRVSGKPELLDKTAPLGVNRGRYSPGPGG